MKNSRLTHSLQTFRIFQIIIAVVCIAIPLFLRAFDRDTHYPRRVSTTIIEELKYVNAADSSLRVIPKDRLGFRESISDYVYSSNSYLYGMLLCIGAMLFIFNGAVYFRREHSLQLHSKGKWYNIVLGVALLGVICTPHRDSEWLHYLFAGTFFIGNAVVIGLFYHREDKGKSILLSLLTLAFLALSLFVERITLLWSEWLSMTVIGIHLILEAKGRNRPRFAENS